MPKMSRVNIIKKEEPVVELRLEDGTIMKIRMVIGDVWRCDDPDVKDPIHGGSMYSFSNTILATTIPETHQ